MTRFFFKRSDEACLCEASHIKTLIHLIYWLYHQWRKGVKVYTNGAILENRFAWSITL